MLCSDLQPSFLQPLIVVANKCDVKKITELSEENQVGGASFQTTRSNIRNVSSESLPCIWDEV